MILVSVGILSSALPTTAATRSTIQVSPPVPGKLTAPILRTSKVTLSPSHKSGTNIILTNRFQSLSQDYTLPTPPEPSDVNASVGPNNLVETVNAKFAVYSRNGSQLSAEIKLTDWFGFSGNIGDPRIIYDPWGGRFIMVAIDVPAAGQSNHTFFISVAQQSNAFGNWCNYTYTNLVLGGYAADFPTLGVDSNGIYSNLNLFSLDRKTMQNAQLLEVERDQLESCQTPSIWQWSGSTLNDPDCFSINCVAYHIQPAVMHSSAFFEYLVNSRLDNKLSICKLTFWHLDGIEHLLYPPVSLGTKCYSNAPDAPQSGTKVKLTAGDRSLSRVSYMNGLLVAALTSADSSNHNSVIDWFKIDPSNPSQPKLTQQGTLGATGSVWYFYPVIQQDSSGNAIIVYGTSSATTYPRIYYIGLTTSGLLKAGGRLIQSASYYDDVGKDTGTARWGDLQSAELDPTNSTQIWIAGQYALVNAQSQHYWSTYIGQVGFNSHPGGNLWVTGHDADYHCTNDALQCHYMQVAVNFVMNNSTLPVLALDHGSQVATAISSAFGGSGPTVTTVDPRTGFAGLPLVSSRGVPLYSAIVIASDITCGGCDNNDAFQSTPDSDAINLRASDIKTFFDAGGGILALAGAENIAVFYNFLPIQAIGTTTTSPYTLTSLGLSLGLVEGQDDNCCETHNSFQLPSSGSAFQVVETDASGLAETMIAQNAIAVQWIRPTRSSQRPQQPHNHN
jgi:hypothetical protein